MKKRRGNPNWGKPELYTPSAPTVTAFEKVVQELKLKPDQYLSSSQLRVWVMQHKNSRFVPEALLEAWGLQVDSSALKLA